jgi:hypothetical protein
MAESHQDPRVLTLLKTRNSTRLVHRFGLSIIKIESDSTLAHEDGTTVYGSRTTWRIVWRGRVGGWYRERAVAVSHPSE